MPSANRVTYHPSCISFSHCSMRLSLSLFYSLKIQPLSMLTFPLYSILSRTNHNLIPVNNVCTTAWIRTIPDKKNTCSIIQFICYMVLYMLVIKWLLFRLTNKFKLVLISMLFMLCILDNLLHSLVHWWIFSLFSHFLRRLNSQFTRFIFVIVKYFFPPPSLCSVPFCSGFEFGKMMTWKHFSWSVLGCLTYVNINVFKIILRLNMFDGNGMEFNFTCVLVFSRAEPSRDVAYL